MKLASLLTSAVVLSSLTAAVVLAPGLAGCGSDETTPAADETGKQPPAPAAGAPAGDGPGYTFAINRLFLGDTDRSGAKRDDAWKSYGYNLDGKISSRESADLCAPAANGAPSKIYPDGDAGIDNSFGKNIVTLLADLGMDPGKEVNDALAAGTFTVLLRIDGLGDQPSYAPGLLTKLYAGGNLGATPAWDGSDAWPIVRELLDNPADLESTQVRFPSSYVTDDTWVSGTPGQLSLAVSIQGYALTLDIRHAVISMDLATPRSGGATGGIIAGIIEVEPLIAQMQQVAGSLSKSLCTGSSFDTLADGLRQSADILSDGTQDPARTCDAISIGLGFEMRPAELGDVLPAAVPGPDPCLCGNDTLDDAEICDGTLLAGQDCTTLGEGFTGGTLACADDCASFVTTACTGG